MTFGNIYSEFYKTNGIYRIEEILIFFLESKSSVYLRRLNLETPDNPGNLVFFPEYRVFPFPADENDHRIWEFTGQNT